MSNKNGTISLSSFVEIKRILICEWKNISNNNFLQN